MRFTRADKWLIGLLFAGAVGGIGLNMAVLSTASGQEAHISKNGQPMETIPLRPGYHEELRLGGATGYNLVEADNGRIRVKEADCPDQLCVRSGWIRVSPQQIVCLPYRVVIKIESARPADVDEITR
ncbi:MAG TPA: NusG domain II-containing protein [Selenomonadales bacterium]|nr:NusG domain II-containing protein [Selenomonadales bacterium]